MFKKAGGQKITLLGDLYLPSAFTCNFVPENYIVNLEFVITDEPCGVPGKVNLKSSDFYVEETLGTRPLAVSLANNHVLDYGDKGFVDTIDSLKANGVPYFGAGCLSDNYANPFCVEINQVRVALIAYVCESTSPAYDINKRYGVALIDLNTIAADIAKAAELGADRIIVIFHWGAEHVHKAKFTDVEVARKSVDLGADLVVGHHAHCIQNHEIYNGTHIFYGLGNFIFPDLTVPAHYHRSPCTPSKIYRYKQKHWNKISIAVEYDPLANTAKAYKVRFNSRKLIRAARIKLATGSIKLGDSYRREFKRSYYYGKLRGAFFKWLENPRMPTMKHLHSIYKVLHDKKHT